MQNKKWYKGDTIPGLIIALFGFTVAAYTIYEPTFTWKAQTSDGVPGGGFFPILLSCALGILGLALFIKGLRQNGTLTYFKIDEEVKGNLRKLVKTVIAMVIFFIVWQSTKRLFPSFIPCVAVLSFVLNTFFERPLKYNIIYTVVLTAFLYLAFVVGFSVQFNM